MWEKEKMLVISFFSFSYNVFKSLLFNSLPNDKIQDKLEAVVGDKSDVAKMMISVCDRAENIVG